MMKTKTSDIHGSEPKLVLMLQPVFKGMKKMYFFNKSNLYLSLKKYQKCCTMLT